MEVINSRTLIEARRDVTVPFAVEAVIDETEISTDNTTHNTRTPRAVSDMTVDVGQKVQIEFEQVFRLLPGKRIVGLARCGKQLLLVKLFLGRQAKRYAAKERRGIEMIQSAGVRSPHFHWQASLLQGQGEALAMEYLGEATSLQDRWDFAAEDDERVDVLTRAMIIIAKLHNQGVVQKDIHLGNFLMNGGRMYTIDGGEVIKKSSPPLPEQASLENLSWFFAQFFPRYDELVQVVLPAYDAVRGWHTDPARVIELHSQIIQSRDSRKQAYLDKAFRECTRFHCEKSFSRFMVCERDAYQGEMLDLLDDPDRYIEQGVVLKDGNTATVAKVRVG